MLPVSFGRFDFVCELLLDESCDGADVPASTTGADEKKVGKQTRRTVAIGCASLSFWVMLLKKKCPIGEKPRDGFVSRTAGEKAVLEKNLSTIEDVFAKIALRSRSPVRALAQRKTVDVPNESQLSINHLSPCEAIVGRRGKAHTCKATLKPRFN